MVNYRLTGLVPHLISITDSHWVGFYMCWLVLGIFSFSSLHNPMYQLNVGTTSQARVFEIYRTIIKCPYCMIYYNSPSYTASRIFKSLVADSWLGHCTHIIRLSPFDTIRVFHHGFHTLGMEMFLSWYWRVARFGHPTTDSWSNTCQYSFLTNRTNITRHHSHFINISSFAICFSSSWKL